MAHTRYSVYDAAEVPEAEVPEAEVPEAEVPEAERCYSSKE